MDTRKIASEYRLAHWGGLLQERVASGQSIAGFCTATGISRNTYFYWQRKLREAACNRLAEENTAEDCALVPKGWTQLSSQTDGQPRPAVTIEISGCVVQATEKSNMKLLQSVCQMLKTL